MALKINNIIRMEKIINLLLSEYPDSNCSLNYENPFQLLIATILSAQCTDKRVNKVTRSAKVMPEVTETKANPKFTELRGLDFGILPLIYLEAFVVNILQNLSLNVPERVAIK